MAAKNPKVLKLISNELHKANPSMIGIRANFVHLPVISPIMHCETNTVKIGDELLIVSTNDTLACLSAISPSTMPNSLNTPMNKKLRQNVAEWKRLFLLFLPMGYY